VRKGDDALREKLNQALKAVREDGTYDAIGARYFKSSVSASQ
jgi:polar amino acid transport system substrate-binding protein